LDSKECYLIFDEDARIIWLWKGSKAKIRSKFIGAKKSQELRGQVGLMNKVISIDEGDEPDEFLMSIGAPPRAGRVVAKELRMEANESQQPPAFSTVNQAASQPKAPEPQPMQQPSATAIFQQVGAQPQSSTQSQSFQTASQPVSAQSAPQPTVTSSMSQQNVERVLGILKNLKIPAGYQREMIIIGNSAYSVSVKEQVFLGKKKVEKTLEPIGSLPEGVFFADGYAPRVLVENGMVLAIEFLKKEAGEYGGESVKQEVKSLKDHIKATSPKDLVASLGFKTKKQ
ncbi:MAG: hypothetical protein ACTSRA_03855, partial [Promethearchaeota archaeon]